MRFEIEWLGQPEQPAASEELQTRCRIGLSCGNKKLFRHEDLLGESQVRDAIIASAYPLALWFAANWWRLRWEPAPPAGTTRHDWNMSHMMGAAGSGYAWPNLTFVSDGENMQLTLQPTQEDKGPARYLSRENIWIPVQAFESCADQLVEQTLSRLSGRPEQPPLYELWQTVRDERASPTLAAQRQLEARLGFDPEEAPEALMTALTQLAAIRGDAAIQELACLGHEQIRQTLDDIQESLNAAKDAITLPLRSLRHAMKRLSPENFPWQEGRDAANAARQQLGVDEGPLSNSKLAELLETRQAFLEDASTYRPLPLGIGEVTTDGRTKVCLGKNRKESRRFMAARMIAAGVYDGREGGWLPCTNTSTVQQKFQRAFAQEFLCPYQDLINWMDTESPDEDLMEAAAEHFEVSPLLINTVMVSHGHMPHSELDAFQPAI